VADGSEYLLARRDRADRPVRWLCLRRDIRVRRDRDGTLASFWAGRRPCPDRY